MVTIELGPGDPATPEYSAAEQLRDIFERDLPPDAEGRALILPNLYLWGEKVRQIDLLALGQFEPPLRCRVTCAAESGDRREPAAPRVVHLRNFCWCIEVKDHEQARFVGATVYVEYNGQPHDVTTQSDGQLQSLRRFIRAHAGLEAGLEPYICNLIWLRNIDRRAFPALPHTCVGRLPAFEHFLERALTVRPPLRATSAAGHPYYLSSSVRGALDATAFERFARLREVFTQARESAGKLTRDKVELITRGLLAREEPPTPPVGEKLTVIRGRAGTGKTIRLLRLAFDLCARSRQRCLLLTYNQALVSDIRRLIALAQVSDSAGEPTVDVRTVHSFLRRLMIGFGVYAPVKEQATAALVERLNASPGLSAEARNRQLEQFEDEFYLRYYDALKRALLDHLRQRDITPAGAAGHMSSQQDQVAWDAILIDEAQDWPADERDILFRVFPPGRFVIADGIDQFVRAPQRIDWTQGVPFHTPIAQERRSLRQKSNLCQFVTRMAAALGVPWDVTPQPELSGGRALILPRRYDEALHSRLYQECLQAGNKAYEMLFLAPPSLVDRAGRGFRLKDEWAAWGIQLWDGTLRELRAEYPASVSEHRLLQYDSCRGLEGWTVVCLDFDDFVAYKRASAVVEAPPAGDDACAPLRDEDEARRLHAGRWALIPLTRAIDTLVITLRDPRSDTARLLRDVASRLPDCVTWLE